VKIDRTLAPGLAGLTLLSSILLAADGEKKPGDPSPPGIAERVAWTTSRITGTPEPPLPFRTERLFPHLSFKNPLDISTAPGTNRLFVAEQAGAIYSFPPDPGCKKADLFIDLAKEVRTLDKLPDARGVGAVYGLTFHPDFARNRYCYICYVLRHKKGGQHLERGTRVSRFTVSRADPPRCDPASEVVLIDWLEGGHNGGCLKFGPDGYLYITTGDGEGPHPPDPRRTGQDVSDLLSSILRIDVDHAEGGRPYRIPPDNPFVGRKGIRPEIWAYGLRNPWKMNFDRKTGELWVGDVGWERWELVYRVEKGANFGWSVMEGPQPVHPQDKRGPTPILPPQVALPHPEAASVTGGYVYRGKRFPELVGHYVYGDYETRRLWANRLDGKEVGPTRLLALTNQRIVAFAEDPDGELILLDYQGTLHGLAANKPAKSAHPFPRTLSATGLFRSVAREDPAPGVVPFSINARLWADHAEVKYWAALPGTASVGGNGNDLKFPPDSVLAKTLSLQMEAGNPATRRKLETQVLHFDGTLWRGYSYRWNPEQTDAVLVGPRGDQERLTVRDAHAPGGKRVQTWRYPSRAECATCHNPWAKFTLAYNVPQLRRDHAYAGHTADQVATLQHIGYLPGFSGRKGKDLRPLADPYGDRASLDHRARSYLHVNCSHCHRNGGGGTALIDVQRHFDLRRTKLVTHPPTQGTFGIHGAQVVYPGDPFRSVLFYRLATLGQGRMPHLGSHIVDEAGLDVIERWVRAMPRPAYLPAEEPGLAEERAEVSRLAAALPGAEGKDFAKEVTKLLGSTSGTLALMRLVDRGKLSPARRAEVIAKATAHERTEVRDLFERFLPPEQRLARLGTAIDPAAILALKGDAGRGEKLFFAEGSQCASCHVVNGHGKEYGPELSKVGARLTARQILESLLEPSRIIDPQYVSYTAETKKGVLHTGLLVEKTATHVVLKDAQHKRIRLGREEIAQLTPQPISAMPEHLLKEMTAQQAADLIAYLAGRK
jgi:putative heme-binding domain-containing protein